MTEDFKNDPMLEMFLCETDQQLEQMEEIVMNMEDSDDLTTDAVHEIFRIMHTLKSSSAMMMLNNISTVAHRTEDLFYFIREEKPEKVEISPLSDLIFSSLDFMKAELEKIKAGEEADGQPDGLIDQITAHLERLKQLNNAETFLKPDNKEAEKRFYISSDKKVQKLEINHFTANVFFEENCGMENIRAFAIVHQLKEKSESFTTDPEDVINEAESADKIRQQGFKIRLKTRLSDDEIRKFLEGSAAVDRVELEALVTESSEENVVSTLTPEAPIRMPELQKPSTRNRTAGGSGASNGGIYVSVEKLDQLMNLMGEMVISESMVTQNPDLEGLVLDNFSKSARQLRKITNEIQDMVMAIRMVPLGPTFHKMHRIVRDISKKMGKEINLNIIGEETEVDKNIIDQIGDPLMHIVRNAADHGIETCEERLACGKEKTGTITLEACNAGSDVLIIIRDDGKGLKREGILNKAIENGLIDEMNREMSDQEVFKLIFLPGFSTKEVVTEFSGRGVGMDVVATNIEAIGGSILMESQEGKGSIFTLKIPLTLAIIEGMNVRVGNSRYTLPITRIKESFIPQKEEVFANPNHQEMIMIRGECYPILRLHEYYLVKNAKSNIEDGILMMVEGENKTVCLLVDELLGEQQVVVKTLPKYIRRMKKIPGLAGCTLLGNGGISLILDIDGFISQSRLK
ncbi:MAG: two-component system, chemotaxis family, sensor kinase CheA [Eubacteriaceae bacterium]|nr:two-component system, chemotaxis family, sensor kinase CheA [Eubacteriaceae bacterium]